MVEAIWATRARCFAVARSWITIQTCVSPELKNIIVATGSKVNIYIYIYIYTCTIIFLSHEVSPVFLKSGGFLRGAARWFSRFRRHWWRKSLFISLCFFLFFRIYLASDLRFWRYCHAFWRSLFIYEIAFLGLNCTFCRVLPCKSSLHFCNFLVWVYINSVFRRPWCLNNIN